MESDLQLLVGRINAEFARSKSTLESLRRRKIEEYQGRQNRLEDFMKVCTSLEGVWRPRLEALRDAFGENVRVSPQLETGRRQASFAFTSSLAQITLTFTATTDFEVRKLILEYSLVINPSLMSFPGHARREQPFELIDPKAIGAWFDDRIVEFTKTYLSLHENEHYLSSHMVEDPVAHVRFPDYAAASTLDRGGKLLYFIANETREQFEAKEKADRRISG